MAKSSQPVGFERGVVDEDQALMVAVATGDRQGLAALYDRYAPLLLALGVRLLGDRREAEDVLHDVFIEAWHDALGYDPRRGSVRGWLALRMRSRSIDRRRTPGRSRSRVLSPADFDRVIGHVVADETSLDRRHVRDALDGLPEDQRAVLVLAYFDGLSSREIAERIGVPHGTVKSRIAAALTRMRGVLVDQPLADEPARSPESA